MRFPKLTPLQSRFAASLAASVTIVIIYFVLSKPQFAYAAHTVSHHNADHNHHRLYGGSDIDEFLWGENEEVVRLQSVHEEEIHIGLVKRADPGKLSNNVPANDELSSEQSKQYVFDNATLFGKPGDMGPGFPSPMFMNTLNYKDWNTGLADVASLQYQKEDAEIFQNGSRAVYISITACTQPTANGTNSPSAPAPQLTLYVSSQSNPSPDNAQHTITLDEGYASLTYAATGDVHMTVSAPEISQPLSGGWSYQITASIDAFYHSYSADQSLLLLDTDNVAALFVSNNLTNATGSDPLYQDWMNMWPPPLTMFAHNTNDSSINGVRHSYCGLQNYAQIQPEAEDDGQIQMSMTERPVGPWGSWPQPKQQFYINGLNGSSTYYGIMAMKGNSTKGGPGIINGGGQVWDVTNFATKSDGNCQLLFNLTTCPLVAHAVPTSPQYLLDTEALMSLYDSAAEALYQNFSYSLQQIPCNTTQTAQYSLARNCTDCDLAYRNWLCAVTIPRCADFSSTSPHLQPRNINPLSKLFTGSPLNNFAPAGTNNSIPDSILDSPTYVPMPSAPAQFPFINQSLASALSSNSSRNALAACGSALNVSQPIPVDDNGNPNCGLDQSVKPGPYKEVLPCAEYCYELVRSCPASFGFQCPSRGKGLETSYGFMGESGMPAGDGMGGMQCTMFGAVMAGNTGLVTGGGERRAVGRGLVGSVGAFMVLLALL
ncbi:MAG: stretch-activated cation channel mid1 [Bogoriella megaspora]|nr:MAG: stretch-activated cation channel mid1 [Bogoriella megaspora]